MLYFCTHVEDDGRWYLITNQDPREYYNWKGWQLCNPQIASITAKEAKRISGISVSKMPSNSVEHFNLRDWKYYLDVISPKLKYL